MNQELKQTILEICNKYNVAAQGNAYSVRHNILIQMELCQHEKSIEGKFHNTAIFNGISFQLTITGCGGYGMPTLNYKDSVYLSQAKLMAANIGVRLTAKQQDFVDIFNAMRENVNRQNSAKQAQDKETQDVIRGLRYAYNLNTNTGR